MSPVKKPRSSPARESEILEVVLQLVAHDGYDAVSVDGIAAAARASKSTLYRLWSSKAEMVVDAVSRNIRTLSVPPPADTLRGDLVMVLSQMAEQLTGKGDGDLAIELMGPSRRHPELRHALQIKFREPAKLVLGLALERAVARDELAPGPDVDLVHDVSMSMLINGLLQYDQADKALAEAVVDRVLLPMLLHPTNDTA